MLLIQGRGITGHWQGPMVEQRVWEKGPHQFHARVLMCLVALHIMFKYLTCLSTLTADAADKYADILNNAGVWLNGLEGQEGPADNCK